MKTTYYSLPEEDRERLTRTEMQAVRWCLAAISSIAYAQDDLASRLDCIPYGRIRWRLMLGHLRACLNDVLGTTPLKQRKTIQNVMNDMELRMVPKLSSNSQRVTMDVEDLSLLVRAAKKDYCSACILTDEECRKCELYKVLESVAPLDDYGDGSLCPYSKEEWWNA